MKEHKELFLDGSQEKREKGKRMVEALREQRFFLLEEGISSELMARKLELDRKLFALPEIERYRAANINDAGYQPEGKEYTTSGKLPDKKRMWQTFRERELGEPTDGFPVNKWPPIPELRETSLALYAAYEARALEVLGLLEIGLELPAGSLTALAVGGNSLLRTNYYPDEHDLAPNEYGSSRNVAHTDINLVTLMQTPTTDGFEVFTEARGWQPVPAKPHSVIVITGKLLLGLTNGYLQPAWHRVVEGQGERFSHPFFLHPRPNALIAPLEQFLSSNPIDAAPSLTAFEFLRGIREDLYGLRDWVKRHSDVPPERRFTR